MKKSLVVVMFAILQTTIWAQDLRKDIALGEEGLAQVKEQIGIFPFVALDTVLQQLGQRLVSQLDKPLFDYEFYLVDMPEPNAFALPGGKIFVTRGLLLLPLTEDELAGVIGHEIIHANNRHSIKQQRNSVFGALIAIPGLIIGGLLPGDIGQALASPFLITDALLTSSYSRGHESEADEQGIVLAAKAGYQPLELAEILTRLNNEAEFLTGEEEEKSYFSSHPYTPKRVKAIEKEAPKLTVSSQPHLVNSAKYLSLFNDLLVDENPLNGFKATSGTFYQPSHLYALELSDAWQTQTSPQMLSVRDTANEVMAVIGVEKDSVSHTDYLKKFEKGMLQQSNLKPTKKDDFTWFGYEGGMLEYEQNSAEGKIKLQIVAISYADGQLLKLLAMYKEKAENKFSTLLKSMKTVTKVEIPAAEVTKLFVVEALDNETLEQLIARENVSDFAAHIAVINGVALSHTFKKGELVKILKQDLIQF